MPRFRADTYSFSLRDAARPAASSRSAWRGALLLAGVAALGAAGLAARRRSDEAEYANPPVGKFVEVEGVRLHYLERGSGQPLVLIHGLGSMIQDFQLSGLIEQAAQRYRVIVFDRPGYGYSARPRSTVWTPQRQAELLHHALHKLGIEQTVVVGHSLGTVVALALALTFPATVKSLVLLSGYYYPTARFDVPLLAPPAIPIVGDVLRYTVSPWIGRLMWPGLLRLIFGPAPVPASFDGFPMWLALRPGQLRASAADSALLLPTVLRLAPRYGELRMPVMIVAGDADRYVNPHAHSARLHAAIDHSELELCPGAGHMIHHLALDAVLAAIDRAAQRQASTNVTSNVTALPVNSGHQLPPSTQLH